MATKELDDIEGYMLLHGHQCLDKVFELDDDLLAYVKEIVEFDIPDLSVFKDYYIFRRAMKANAIKFYDSVLTAREVGYLSDSKLKRLLAKGEVESVAELIDMYNEAPLFTSPFKIPIKYCYKSSFAGTLQTQVLITEQAEFHKEILPRLNVYFSSILLSKNVTDLTVSCYLHEIMHSQLEKNKGVIGDYYNSEILSIFMELLYAYENNLENYMRILTIRINHMMLSFNSMYMYQTGQLKTIKYDKTNFIKDGKYLISIMKAFNLFYKYINGSTGMKKQMLVGIQSVIDAEKQLEEFLTDYDVDYNSSKESSITKKLIIK